MSTSEVQEGYVGNLTEAQQKALDTVRSEFKEEIQALQDADSKVDLFRLDDHRLLRFLRAREWDVDAAIGRIRATMVWRQQLNVGNMLADPPTFQKTNTLLAQITPWHIEADKDGLPMYLELTGRLHRNAMLKHARGFDVMYNHVHDMEDMLERKASEERQSRGHHIEKSVTILDLHGLNMGFSALLPYLQAMTDVDEAHYPESLKSIYVINAPRIFPALWQLIQLFLDPDIAQKVRIIGTTFKDMLVDEVFGCVERLPVIWGGERKLFPEWEDEKTVLARLDASIASLGLTESVVAAGKTFEVKTAVAATADTTVQWMYCVTAYDVVASVVFEGGEGGSTIVCPETKQSTGNRWGNYTVPAGTSGNLILVFDNTGSWMRSKTVKHIVKTRAFDAAEGDRMGEHTPYLWHTYATQ